MPENSDVFLVRGSLQLIEGEQLNPTIQRTLWCASSTAILTADDDYFIVSVAPLTVGAFVLAASPTTVASIGIGNSVSFDVIAALQNTSAFINGGFDKIRWFWKKGTKIYLVSTVGMGVTLTLERVQ